MLWTAGPALGPAVLVWGVMLVLLLISIAFGRIKQLPLNTLQWILLPLFVYRIIMLLWALWLAYSLINWLKWGWSCYSERALWRPKPKKKTASRRPANKLISEEGGDEAHIV